MTRRSRPAADRLRKQVARRAGGPCEYCQAPEKVCAYRFHLEHIVPRTHGGSDDASNRAFSCVTCNLAKSEKTIGIDPRTGIEVVLFDPRRQTWANHFAWDERRRLIRGLTPAGRATVVALNLNGAIRRQARRLWFRVGLLP